MADSDPAEFWKRTSGVLATLLVLAGVTICSMLAVLTWKSKVHDVELKALRAQFDRERETLTTMWQATDDALKREQRKSARGER
jgi:hypothetical protein